MRLPFYIARKYFFSGKVSNLIHLISGVSMTGIIVGSFALIVILSVFNGLEKLVLSLYNNFDSDIRIELKEGKYFEKDEAGFEELQALDEVKSITGIIEESVMLRFDDNQAVGTFRAMEPDYVVSTGMDSLIFRGSPRLKHQNENLAIIGVGLANQLDISVYDEFSRLQIYMPRPGRVPVLRPDRGFNKKTIAAGGVFSVQKEFDEEYFVIPLDFAYELVERDPGNITNIEINLTEGASLSYMRNKIQEIAGDKFDVKDRFQQHEMLYQILETERLAVYLILTFILVIASFNMVGALLMLAIEKRSAMAILNSMGITPADIRKVYYWEGLLLSGVGGIIGIILGAMVCWAQMQWGLVKLGTTGAFVVEAYPVSMEFMDFILVFITVIAIGLLASIFPAWAASRNISAEDLHQ